MNQVSNICSAVILAGGKSSRMGFPKAWMEVCENVTFLEKNISDFRQFGIEDVIVVLNEEFAGSAYSNKLEEMKSKAKIIYNRNPELGRLHSLSLGLKQIQNESVFIHNVDSPFVEQEVLRELYNNPLRNGIVIPTYMSQGGHPVLVSGKVQQEIVYNHGNYESLRALFKVFPRKHVEVESDSVLVNINTAKDFEKHLYEAV